MTEWDNFKAYAHRYRWFIAFCIVVFFGYQLGADRAHRDNARDKAALAEQAG